MKKGQIEKGNKVLIEKENKSPNRKGKIKVQMKIEKSKLELKKKSLLRPRCKIAVNNRQKFELLVKAKVHNLKKHHKY